MKQNTSLRIQEDNRFRFWISLSVYFVCALLTGPRDASLLIWETLLFVSYVFLFGTLHLAAKAEKTGLFSHYLLITADSAAITAAVYLTGRIQSPLYILYVVLFGICIYHRSLSSFVYTAVLSFSLYTGMILKAEPLNRVVLFELLGQLILMGILTGILYAILVLMLKEKRMREKLMKRANTSAKIANVLSATHSNLKDFVMKVSSLIEEEVRPDGLKCRISLHKGNQVFLPPSGGAFGIHIPIMVGGSILGTMVITREEKKPLNPSEEDFFSSVGRSLGMALHRGKLWEEFESRLQKIEASLLLNANYSPASDQNGGFREEARNVEMMLDVISIERGRWKMKKEACALSKIFEEELKKAKKAGSEKKVSIFSEEDFSASATLLADPQRVQSALGFLLSQAVQASSEKEKVTVSIKQNDSIVLIKIKDQSLSSSQTELDEIFNKPAGVSSEGNGKDRQRSAEFGFYVCRKIVEGHGGEVWAKSLNPNKGREFGFSLPIESAAPVGGNESF